MRCCTRRGRPRSTCKWALDEMVAAVRNQPREARVAVAYRRAAEIADEDVAICQAIGRNGLKLIEEIAARKNGQPVNVLTHCNAGWLATVDWGTATAPIYTAHDKGIGIHVWVDETRPRNQGASLDRLGARPSRRQAHGDRRQHRRAPDAAWHGRHGHRRHRPRHRAGRRLQQDRHLPQGAGRQGQQRAVLCGAAVADHRLRGVGRHRRDSDRAALRRGAVDHDRPHRRRPDRDRAGRAGRLAGGELWLST